MTSSASAWSDDPDTQIANLEAALESSRTIGAAVGLVMGRCRCTRDAAFEYLVTQSQNRNVKLRLIAGEIVTAAEARTDCVRAAHYPAPTAVSSDHAGPTGTERPAAVNTGNDQGRLYTLHGPAEDDVITPGASEGQPTPDDEEDRTG